MAVACRGDRAAQRSTGEGIFDQHRPPCDSSGETAPKAQGQDAGRGCAAAAEIPSSGCIVDPAAIACPCEPVFNIREPQAQSGCSAGAAAGAVLVRPGTFQNGLALSKRE